MLFFYVHTLETALPYIYIPRYAPLPLLMHETCRVNYAEPSQIRGEINITESSQKCEKKQFPRLSVEAYSSFSMVESGPDFQWIIVHIYGPNWA